MKLYFSLSLSLYTFLFSFFHVFCHHLGLGYPSPLFPPFPFLSSFPFFPFFLFNDAHFICGLALAFSSQMLD